MLASIVIGIGTNFFLVRMLCLWLAETGLFAPALLIGRLRQQGEVVVSLILLASARPPS